MKFPDGLKHIGLRFCIRRRRTSTGLHHTRPAFAASFVASSREYSFLPGASSRRKPIAPAAQRAPPALVPDNHAA